MNCAIPQKRPLLSTLDNAIGLCFVFFQPLNPNPDSRWNTYFKDNEILLQIDKDVRYDFKARCTILYIVVLVLVVLVCEEDHSL